MHSPASPIAVIDLLNDLLEAETSSIFRFMGEGSPYLSRAAADVRRPLEEMVRTIDDRAAAIAELIERLGGTPSAAPRGVDREEQFLSFLSVKFLLPKLLDAKKLLIERYENALRSIRKSEDGAGEARALLARLLDQHKSQLGILQEAADRVAKSK